MTDIIQSRLLRWAAFFLFLQSVILTLSPAVREHSWEVSYRFSHWLGLAVWMTVSDRLHRLSVKNLPERDAYLLPAALLLTGWGLLTIWRLDEDFGLRQTIWFGVSAAVLAGILLTFRKVYFLKNYKYLFLFGGLLLTGMTFFLGTNPLGYGPKLWLGCCGVYFQPSEPLKLLLIIYLAAYLSERISFQLFSFHLLVPTLFVTGLALTLLLVQRDLGTASIFIFLFTGLLFIATGKRRVLVLASLLLMSALALGYFSIEIIRTRLMGWVNPWLDPSGESYQIVQSLLAIANGGVLGRGLGIGSPLLVPVAISDFIYTALVEESGLAGAVGLLALIWLVTARGVMIAQRATDRFRRFLGAGIAAYFGLQSLLIIGGNVRLLPLTGVTLPFVSYGGSSLLTSFAALGLLLKISNTEEGEPAPLSTPAPFGTLATLLGIGFALVAVSTAWWSVVRSPDLLLRTDNPRRSIADRYVLRGAILDSENHPISRTEGVSGSYERVYLYPDLAPVVGYTHPVFGQAGLEASLDPYLRGLQGNPYPLIFWNELLHGTPPPGLDLRLSIDLDLQKIADDFLDDRSGALILMNAETGEILVMASHPGYDPNQLDQQGAALSLDSTAPLMNRAAQGIYPIGSALLPFIRAQYGATQPDEAELRELYQTLGLLEAPRIQMPVDIDNQTQSLEGLRISPLQATRAAATLSGGGILPAPRIATAVNTPEQGWVVLPALGEPRPGLDAQAARDSALAFREDGRLYWSHIGQAAEEDTRVTWLLAGTLPDWSGTPLALAVTVEAFDPGAVQEIAEQLLLNAGINPQ